MGQLNTSIRGAQIRDLFAGDGLTWAAASGTSRNYLAVNVDNESIEIDTDVVQVKALGITNAMISGAITDDKLDKTYVYADGTRPFSGTVSGVTPTDADHLSTKGYVDTAVSGVDQHNELSDIQGGYVDNYYHMSDEQYEVLPNGFVDHAGSTISLDSSTRTVTVTGTSGAFPYYVEGDRYTSAGDTQVITDVDGVHFVYYDASGDITHSTSPWDLSNTAPIAYVLWNTTMASGLIAEERHQNEMDENTHEYLHLTRGTAYQSGFAISGYTLDTGSDAAVTFGLAAGIIRDEDIEVSVTDGTGGADFEQDLTDESQIPVFHRSGNNGPWEWDAATDFAFKNTAAGRVNYNTISGSTWSQTEATDAYYVAYFIIATNSVLDPIISVQGQREDAILQDAKDNNAFASLSFGSLPFQEMKLLYRIILRTGDAYGGTRKVRISDVADFRASSPIPAVAAVASDHGSLTGLGDDDHTQYSLADGTRAFTGTVGGITPVANTDLTTKLYVDTTFSGSDEHSELLGLTVGDDHTQYILHVHASGTQNLAGGVGAGASLQAGASDNVMLGNNAGNALTTGDDNTVMGSSAGENITTGIKNTGMGKYALYLLTTGYNNTAMGWGAGINITTGYANALVGSYAGYSFATSSGNVALGHNAAINLGLTPSHDNVAIGNDSMKNHNTGSRNIAMGARAMYSSTGSTNFDDNIAIGTEAGYSLITGSDKNVLVGNHVGYSLTTGTFNTAMGDYALSSLTTANQNVAIGNNADRYNTTGDGNISIGNSAATGNSFGQAHTGDIFIGRQTGVVISGTSYNVVVGDHGGGMALTTGSQNTLIGAQAGDLMTTGAFNTFMGYFSGNATLTSNYNTAVGWYAMQYNSTGAGNTALGTRADGKQTAGDYNTSVGYFAANGVTGADHSYDTFIGAWAGGNQEGGGEYNVGVGVYALRAITTGSGNIAVGNDTGYSLTTGSENVFLGRKAGYSETTGSNKLYIENSASSTPLIYGEFDNDFVYINGDLGIRSGNEGRFYDVGNSNYVGFEAPALIGNQIWVLPDADATTANMALTSDAAGNLGWTSASGLDGFDHGELDGLADDDHTQYILVDGTRDFTGIVEYNSHPTFVDDTDIVDKKYVDDLTATTSGFLKDHGNLDGLADDDHTQYILVDGSRAFTGSIKANASGTLDIGSLAVPFKDLYLTGASIYLDGYAISEFSNDATLADNSTSALVTESAINSRIATTSGGLQSDIIWEIVDTPSTQIRPKAAHLSKAIYTEGNVTIGGDLTVTGTLFYTDTETVQVSDNILHINYGEVGAGVTAGEAGIQVDRGSETDYYFVFDEGTDTFRVGISGVQDSFNTAELQPVATREDGPTDTRVTWWDDTNKTLRTQGDTYITVNSGTDTIALGVSSTTEMTIDTSGMSLKAGASVNDIDTAIVSPGDDDSLATTKSIVDYVNTVSGSMIHNELEGLQGGDTNEYHHLNFHEEAQISATTDTLLNLGDASGATARVSIDSAGGNHNKGIVTITASGSELFRADGYNIILGGDYFAQGGAMVKLYSGLSDSHMIVYSEQKAVLWINNLIQRIGVQGDTYMGISQSADTITFEAANTVELTIGTGGIALNAGPDVNEILDSTDALDVSSTDDQLATAKLIYDTISGTIMDGTADNMFYVDNSGDMAATSNMTYDADGTVNVLALTDVNQRFGASAATNIDITGSGSRISLAPNDTEELAVNTTGMKLKNGTVYVNDILSVTDVDTIDAGSTDAQLVTAALLYETITSGTVTSAHNDLSGLQGGGGGDYYHLDSTDYNSTTNWDTAYGWGDHSLVGYLTSESDPVFGASPAGGISNGDITNWDAAYTHSTVTSGNPHSLDLDDVPNGTTYGRVLNTQLSAGVYIDATDSVKGIASFDSGDFTVTTGDVVIATSGVNEPQLAIVNAPVTSGVLSWNGTGMEWVNIDTQLDTVTEGDIRLENETGNITGSGVVFTLETTPIDNSVQVFLNGLMQEKGGGLDYTQVASTVTFTVAPEIGDILVIHYIAQD